MNDDTITTIPLSENRPQRVTFTGVDEYTSLLGLQVLSSDYPVEWGILFSPDRQGSGRYPPLNTVRGIVARRGIRLAAHLCGRYAKEFLETGTCSELKDLLPAFGRIQINTTQTVRDTARLNRIGLDNGWKIILQCRGEFPADPNVTWLFDASGGHGIAPSTWPASPTPATYVGYAGGLGPQTIAGALAVISSVATSYYVDMETGVRDEEDKFSTDRCRSVLHQVYGQQKPIAKL